MINISIITVVRNNKNTIADCILSILSQSKVPFEYIIIDGNSTDGTLDEIKKYTYPGLKLVSEADKGIYDAMNKGLKIARGEVVGILNSDDLYDNPDVLENVGKVFEDTAIDACYSDLVYVRRDNTSQVVRYWKSQRYVEGLFRKGWVPPHPTFFVRRSVYEKYGLFDLSFNLAADFDLMLRFIAKNKIVVCYLPCITIRMRLGGATNKSIHNIIKQNLEIVRAFKINDLTISIFFPVYKLVEKLSQFIIRKPYV